MGEVVLKKNHYGAGHIKRLKERFKQGKISRTEILELLLSYAIKGKDVKPQAKDIYAKCKGNFRRIFNVLEKENIIGIGPEAKTLFLLINEFMKSYYGDVFSGNEFSVKNQRDIVDYFGMVCGTADREEVHAVFLNAKNRVLSSVKLGDGTLTQSLLYPREIIKLALKEGALSVVIIHNHPSGDPSPSENDRKVTRKLLYALKEMDMGLLDHLIIGKDSRYYSFYEHGHIESYNAGYRAVTESI
jgi:DNA repair protein RadC